MTETIVRGEVLPATATLLSASEVAARPLEHLGDIEGVTRRVVWRTASAEAGVLHVDAGARLGLHTHRASHHHMWVLDGAAEILGRRLVKGSYAHVPAGVEHDVDATRTEGCSVLYVYSPGA